MLTFLPCLQPDLKLVCICRRFPHFITFSWHEAWAMCTCFGLLCVYTHSALMLCSLHSFYEKWSMPACFALLFTSNAPIIFKMCMHYLNWALSITLFIKHSFCEIFFITNTSSFPQLYRDHQILILNFSNFQTHILVLVLDLFQKKSKSGYKQNQRVVILEYYESNLRIALWPIICNLRVNLVCFYTICSQFYFRQLYVYILF